MFWPIATPLLAFETITSPSFVAKQRASLDKTRIYEVELAPQETEYNTERAVRIGKHIVQRQPTAEMLYERHSEWARKHNSRATPCISAHTGEQCAYTRLPHIRPDLLTKHPVEFGAYDRISLLGGPSP